MSVHKITDWALPYVKKCHTYIDVGAHNGDTSAPLVSTFPRIYAFEPNPTTNLLIPATVKMFPYAGDKNKEVVLTIPNNGGNNPEHGSTVPSQTGNNFPVST